MKTKYAKTEPRVATLCEELGRGRVSEGVVKGTIVPRSVPCRPDLLTLAGTSG